MDLKSFYNGKRVFVTGHTGFKGTWMCQMLLMLGAEVYGYALVPPTEPSLYRLSNMNSRVHSVIGDVRDLMSLQQSIMEAQPEIVIHMAAQPIVRESYANPVYTYDVNVMGTVNVLESIRHTNSVKSFVNVTTDKVYRNQEREEGYRENEELNGFDPYSNSKSCSELVTSSYRDSFLQDKEISVSTMRAGNVIGGGDFAKDRLIPDCVRAIENGTPIILRNPTSVRPYQHVLEPVYAYLLVAAEQYENVNLAGSYNIGPENTDCLMTRDMTKIFCDKWNELSAMKGKLAWVEQPDGGPHEAGILRLNCDKLKSTFGWNPTWNSKMAVEKVVEWTYEYLTHQDVTQCMMKQISLFLRTK